MIKTFKYFWKFSQKRHKSLIEALILSFIRSTITVNEFLALIIAFRAALGEENISEAIIKIVALTLVCVIGNFVTSYFEQTATMKSGLFMVADQRINCGNILSKAPLGIFRENTCGKICATLTTTLSGVESALAMVMIGIVSGLFITACLFAFMMFYDWRIGIISGIGIIAYLVFVNFQMKMSRKNAPALQKAQSELSKEILTFLQGIKVSKAFGLCPDGKLKSAIRKSCEENISLTKKTMPSLYSSSICVAIFESVILLFSVFYCFESGSISLIKVLTLIIFSFVVYLSLNQAGSMLSMIGLIDSGLAEVRDIENIPSIEVKSPEEYPQSDEIDFTNVSFSYGENEVLKDVSLKIKPNLLTAIIGPSGSGKTTLCQLIPRFRDVNSGKITIGGADVRSIPEDILMSKISMVFQNVYLFEDTILNNIRFGVPEASNEKVIEAAKKAQCHDFIMALPDGYDTVVKEGGCNLSGGEKQRISIARAILKDSPIIILDEATSALDAENEHEILKAIDNLTKNKTVIMIAHRIKSVRKADSILVLKDGKIVQHGTHNELKDVSGVYSDFLNARKKAQKWEVRA